MEARPPQTIFKDAKEKTQQTLDGFHNFAARLGVIPRECEDNLLSKGHYQFNLVTRNRVQLEAAYRGSWIVGQVVDTIADDMTRAGIEITTNEGAEQVQEIQASLSRLKIWTATCSNIKWGRLYGGALAVMQIQGQKPETPLDLESIQQGQFKGLVVYDRWQVNPDLTRIISTGPDMGLPEYYSIVLGSNPADPGHEPGLGNTDSTGQVRVHHSRCIRSIGIELPFWQAASESLWGESVLERMWDRLIAFDDATLATGNLINRAQLRTVGISGLREILAAGGPAEEALIAQFEYMRKFQQNEGISLLDKEDTFESTAYSFAGISDVLIQFGQQISGSSTIPLVKLFGQSPAGMNASGESDIRLYYDGINSRQEATLRNPFETLLKVLWVSETGKPRPKDMTFSFTPLWQMSAIDKATIAKSNTDTILEANQAGAIDMATTMKELKQTSGDNGIFTHITDEMIEEAKQEEPPAPDLPDPDPEPSKEKPKQEEAPPEVPPVEKKQTGDSALTKIKKWLDGLKKTDL